MTATMDSSATHSEIKFSDSANGTTTLARRKALELGNDFVSDEHIFLAIVSRSNNSAIDALTRGGINIERIKQEITSSIATKFPLQNQDASKSISQTAELKQILTASYAEARKYGSITVRNIHILISILRDVNAETTKILESHKFTYATLSAIINDYSLAEAEQKPKVSLPPLKDTKFSIKDHFEPVIGIRNISSEISNLIINLKASDKGKMIGIFGNWGRGKTFLAELIWEDLSSKSIEYKRVYFHAWKYQDTQATWAYLYETLSENYFKHSSSSKIVRFGSRLWRIMQLNIIRNGYYNLVLSILAVSGLVVIGYALWLQRKLVPSLIGTDFTPLQTFSFLVPTAILLIRFVRDKINNSYAAAINLLQKYYNNKSYSDLLGNQFEIQKEIKALLKAWLKAGAVQEKILLIVDDIDRCNEDRVIQVIDSLRIMLEDDEISQKVIVLAAVDERILRLAVARKYYDFLDKDFSLKGDSSKSTLISKKMTTDYLDKLFIAGIRLGKLSAADKQTLFSAFVKQDVMQQETASISSQPLDTSYLPTDSAPLPSDSASSVAAPELPKSLAQENVLSDTEHKHIRTILGISEDDMTPRQIKIFYYRYLLARNLLFKIDSSFSSEQEVQSARNFLASILIAKCSGHDEAVSLQYARVINTRNKNEYEQIIVFETEYSLRPELIAEVFTVSEMVIGY